MNKQDIFKSVKIIVLALAVTIGANTVFSDWTPAPPSPPNGNVDAPINIGTISQHKAGALSVGKASDPQSGVSLDVPGLGWFGSLFAINATAGNLLVTNDAVVNGPWNQNVPQLKIGDTLSNHSLNLYSNGGGSIIDAGGDALYIQHISGGNTLISPNTNNPGKVGIGNASPRVKLDVTGQIDASGDICSDFAGKCMSQLTGGGGSSGSGIGPIEVTTFSANGNDDAYNTLSAFKFCALSQNQINSTDDDDTNGATRHPYCYLGHTGDDWTIHAYYSTCSATCFR